MRFLRPFLCKLLNVATGLEQSSRERALERRLAQADKLQQRLKEAHAMELAQVENTLTELRRNISSLNQIIESRNRTIESLEHEKDILQIDVKGMTSVNARLTKWIESLRVAEEKPLIAGANLRSQLADIESSIPWEAT